MLINFTACLILLLFFITKFFYLLTADSALILQGLRSDTILVL